MPVHEDHPNARFAVHVWRDDDDDDGKYTHHETLAAAQAEYDVLNRGGHFAYGGLYEWAGWVNGEPTYDTMDTWPEGWDGVSDFEPE